MELFQLSTSLPSGIFPQHTRKHTLILSLPRILPLLNQIIKMKSTAKATFSSPVCPLPLFQSLIPYTHRVQSCQLIGHCDIKSNQLGPLQPVHSDAFPCCDNGLGSSYIGGACSQSHRHAPASEWLTCFSLMVADMAYNLVPALFPPFHFSSGGNWK